MENAAFSELICLFKSIQMYATWYNTEFVQSQSNNSWTAWKRSIIAGSERARGVNIQGLDHVVPTSLAS